MNFVTTLYYPSPGYKWGKWDPEMWSQAQVHTLWMLREARVYLLSSNLWRALPVISRIRVWMLNVPTKAHVKALVPRVAVLGSGAIFKMWEPPWEVLRSLGTCPWKKLWGFGPFLSLFCSLAHDVSSFASSHTPAMMCYLKNSLEKMGSTNHRLEPPKLWAKINLSSL
jgi:hypothetical protein